MTGKDLLFLALMMLLLGAACWAGGMSMGSAFTREEAAKHGAGRWVADPRTGAVRFEWGPAAP